MRAHLIAGFVGLTVCSCCELPAQEIPWSVPHTSVPHTSVPHTSGPHTSGPYTSGPQRIAQDATLRNILADDAGLQDASWAESSLANQLRGSTAWAHPGKRTIAGTEMERLIRSAKFASQTEVVGANHVTVLDPQPSLDANHEFQNAPGPQADRQFSTASMIGPLQDAVGLFGRLDLTDRLLDNAETIGSGTRMDPLSYQWMPATYTWISPVFYHKPLYFEQPNLERYGLGGARIAQPLLSSAHFFGSIPLIPYKTLTHHPREKVYTLGQGRPGNCVPVQRRVLLGPSTVGEVLMFWEGNHGY